MPITKNPTDVMASTETSIRSSIAAFADAYNRGDADALMSCYAPDLVKLRYGAEEELFPVTASRVRGVLADYSGHLDVTVDEIIDMGRYAFVRGAFSIRLVPRRSGDGETREFSRRYFELWRRDEGRWLVIRTMDNVGAA